MPAMDSSLPVLLYLLLLLAVLLGWAAGAWLQRRPQLPLRYILTFSGAYLLGIAVFHQLPSIYDSHAHHYGLFIMLGFFLQLILETFSKGVEHGHAHPEAFTQGSLPYSLLISLYLHAFLESLALQSHGDPGHFPVLLWGILVHKVPVAIILYGLLRQLARRTWQVALGMLFFALMAPLGALLTQLWPFLQDFYHEVSALVFGIFLHISTTILFEADKGHHFHRIKFSIIILALALAYLSVLH